MRQYSRSHVKEICAELMLSMFRYKDEQKVQIKKTRREIVIIKEKNNKKILHIKSTKPTKIKIKNER